MSKNEISRNRFQPRCLHTPPTGPPLPRFSRLHSPNEQVEHVVEVEIMQLGGADVVGGRDGGCDQHTAVVPCLAFVKPTVRGETSLGDLRS